MLSIETKPFLTVDDIAEYLDIGRDAANGIAHRIGYVRVGNGQFRLKIRVRNEVFFGWLSQQDGYEPVGIPLKAVKGGKRADL